jgi:hypothetical protein
MLTSRRRVVESDSFLVARFGRLLAFTLSLQLSDIISSYAILRRSPATGKTSQLSPAYDLQLFATLDFTLSLITCDLQLFATLTLLCC